MRRDFIVVQGMISIIVPVYNCEKYLNTCVDSILKQSYEKLEILLVDDGSTDQSGRICDQYQEKDKRIRVIHKTNGGQQDARSEGIEVSKGEYIAFVDSDDWIEREMYENLLHEMGNADLVTSGIFHHDENQIVKETWIDRLPEDNYDTEEKRYVFFDNLIMYQKYKPGEIVLGGILNNNCCKLFRTSVVKRMFRLANVSIRYEEDALFSILYALQCQKIKITHKCYYHYMYNVDSVTNNVQSDYWERKNKFYIVLLKALQGHYMEKELKKQLKKRYFFMFYNYVLRANKEWFPAYSYPDEDELNGKKIVLFGAGEVGQNFYHEMALNRKLEIVSWMDNKVSQEIIMGRKIEDPQNLLRIEYDYVICAVKKREMAESMGRQLVDMGIAKDKILWREPVNVFEKMIFE